MAQFLVKVADDRGHLAQQVEHGYSESEVRERFVQQGYLVYWVKPRGLFSGGKLQFGGRKVKQSQFVIFNQQFLTLIKAGLPILNSLDLLIKRQKDAQPEVAAAECSRAGEERRTALGLFRRARRFSQDLHHHADGG